jgi:hypothetical protein
MAADYEIWLDPMGRPAHLIPVGEPVPAEGEDPWFADDPGMRPPFTYRIEAVHNPRLALTETVCPYEPWNYYDAISDRLIRNGWTPPAPTEGEMAECEHGLSARWCSGPNHY